MPKKSDLRFNISMTSEMKPDKYHQVSMQLTQNPLQVEYWGESKDPKVSLRLWSGKRIRGRIVSCRKSLIRSAGNGACWFFE